MNINEVIIDSRIFAQNYILRDGYEFRSLIHPANIYNAIVIKDPQNASYFSPRIVRTGHSLSEQIEFINQHQLENAIVIANDISFITQCPTLKHLEIIPADNIGDNFDFSPLYDMPEIKSLVCKTEYGIREEHSSQINYLKIKGLEDTRITGKGHLNYNCVNTLRSLQLSDYKDNDLSQTFKSEILDTLSMIQCKIKSLNGLQKSIKMQCLYLYYNRFLHDITTLRDVKKTLKALRIENCSKINDFTVLDELENLELLELSGSNTLPDLKFLKNMKCLKTFILNMNVEDGDLTPCLNLSYVYSEKNHKHYNLKDKDLPKNDYIRGNENIELWRRKE